MRVPYEPIRNHIYLGRNAYDNRPTFVPVEQLFQHLGLFGNPGCGKTTKLENLSSQFIRSGEISVCIFNPKPLENDLLGIMRSEVEKLRKKKPGKEYPFWVYSMRPGRTSHLLKLFHGVEWERLPPEQQSDTVMSALSFTYSRSSEEAFFVDSSRRVVRLAFQKARKNGEIIRSFKRLHQVLTVLMHPRNKELTEHERKHGAHATYLIERMAQIESLNVDGHPAEIVEKGIDLARFVEEPCFAYFELDSFTDPAAAGEVARSALTAFFAQISARTRRVPVMFILDEAPQLLSESVKPLFRQARATNCGFVFAAQSVSDLIDQSSDLLSTILSTTAVQVFMRVSDPVGIELLQKLAGQRREWADSVSISRSSDGKRSRTFSTQETMVNRINMAEIERVNSDQHLEFVRVISNKGLAQFGSAIFVNRWDYDRTKEEYEQLCKSPWPEYEPGMIVVGQKGPQIPGRASDEFDDEWEPEELGPETATKDQTTPPETNGDFLHTPN